VATSYVIGMANTGHANWLAPTGRTWLTSCSNWLWRAERKRELRSELTESLEIYFEDYSDADARGLVNGEMDYKKLIF
jgi:hypothetical protein